MNLTTSLKINETVADALNEAEEEHKKMKTEITTTEFSEYSGN